MESKNYCNQDTRESELKDKNCYKSRASLHWEYGVVGN